VFKHAICTTTKDYLYPRKVVIAVLLRLFSHCLYIWYVHKSLTSARCWQVAGHTLPILT